MGKGLRGKDTNNMWQKNLNDSSGIIKPPVQAGQLNIITWTALDDATIVSMSVGGSSYTEIALALSKGLNRLDIKNRWHWKLKESSGIIKPFVQGGKPGSITWTAEDDATITSMNEDGSFYAEIASALGKGLK